MQRYIQMLTSTWDLNYLTALVRGITVRLQGEDISLHIFNAYDEIHEKDYYEQGLSVFSLPDADNYAGMIAVFNSVDSTRILSDQVALYSGKGKPVASIDQHADGASFFGLDNYRSMYNLVEHMVTVHNCRIFNYVGGPYDNEENRLRFSAFKDCLTAHGIETDPARIRHYRFLLEDGREAYNDFKESGLHLPDAVICANDAMAYGYCLAAAADGRQAPDDFRITGFDNVEEAQNYLPSITSINRSWEQLGYDVADGLVRMINSGSRLTEDSFTPGFTQINESCGCNAGCRNLKDDYMSLLDKLSSERRTTHKLYDVRKNLLSSPNISNFLEKIRNSCSILSIPDYAVCLNENFYKDEYGNISERYNGKIRALAAGTLYDIDPAVSLLPPVYEDADNNIYIFSALHFGKETFGYCVMPFNFDLVSSGAHRSLMDSLSLALINIKQHMFLDMMNDKLRVLYVHDTLTGLYNRFGYRDLSVSFYGKHKGMVFVMYADLDNLKTINDRYGHNYGDRAIIALADALKATFSSEDIKIRMGGDEFVVIGRHPGEQKLNKCRDSIEKFLVSFSRDNDFPVTIKASVAYAGNESPDNIREMEALVQEADRRMYEIKKQHHAIREKS